jgi:hypothetical protein
MTLKESDTTMDVLIKTVMDIEMQCIRVVSITVDGIMHSYGALTNSSHTQTVPIEYAS